MRRILIVVPLLFAAGCTDDRVVRVATQAADRQAQQNEAMSRLNRDVAAVNKHVQEERQQLSEGWNDLEAERQQIARTRRTESALSVATKGTGLLIIAGISVAIAWLVLSGLRHEEPGPDELCQVLLAQPSVKGQLLTLDPDAKTLDATPISPPTEEDQ